MGKRASSIFALDVETLDDAGARHVRVERRLRMAILKGSFQPGARLPSSRALARDLKVSRHTIEWAFSNLQAEGLIERRRGAGTYVAKQLPPREEPPDGNAIQAAPIDDFGLSKRGKKIAAAKLRLDSGIPRAFTPSLPCLSLFPRQIWARAIVRAIRRTGPESWSYAAPVGVEGLRRAIAAHVSATRGITCSADRIIVVTSAHQALGLASIVLCDAGDRIWIEEPGYPAARHIFAASGLEPVPVPVDQSGFDPGKAVAHAPDARLAYVTPSHQYPTGVLMPLERRRALLDWARQSGGWILEDDYDGDFCFLSRPLAALQALDPMGRVIYVGTFNKVMFPGLRIAYLIVPDILVDAFAAAKKIADGFTNVHIQSALADFIESGHLGEHLRRMLVIYDERRNTLIEAARGLDELLDIRPCDAGLHTPAYMRVAGDDRVVSAACARRGIDLYPLSRYYVDTPRTGFVMGFAAPNPEEIRRGLEIVAAALRT